MCCRVMSHTPEAKSSSSTAADATPRGFGGLGLVGVPLNLARMQAPPPLPPRSTTHSASSVVLSSPLSPGSSVMVRPEGEGAAGQGQEGVVTAGTGEEGAKGGQERTRAGAAAMETVGAGGKAGEQRKPEATGPG